MIRFLSSSLLVLGLITAVPALAQETQVFDFDFDQRNDGTLVTPTPDASREPITAPVRPAAKTAPGHDSSTAPLPPSVSEPVKAPVSPPAAKDKDGVIVVIGEPDPPAAQNQTLGEDELYNLFAAPEDVTLTPEGLPPTTSVPAGPGEARVEKSKADQPAAPKTREKAAPEIASPKKGSKASAKVQAPAPVKAAKPAAPVKRSAVGDLLVKRGDLYYHRWYLASKAWSRVGAAVSPKTGSLAADRRLYPIDRGVLPRVAPPAGDRIFTDRHSTW